MRQAIYFKRGEDAPVETYFTTLFVITEWERLENRRLGDGKGFGAPNCIRISYAASEEQLMKAMERLTAALAKLSR